jgi:hypothetical protein
MQKITLCAAFFVADVTALFADRFERYFEADSPLR